MRLLGIGLAATLAASTWATTARGEPSRPLTLAAPAKKAKVATQPPVVKTEKRWYGWQVLLVHGLIDAVAAGSLVAMKLEPSSTGAFVAAAVTPIARGLGSYIIESANDNERRALPFGIVSFLAPLIGGGIIGAAAADGKERAPSEDVQPQFAQGFIGGVLLGGSVITAIESSVAFGRSRPVVGVSASPTFVGVNASGMF